MRIFATISAPFECKDERRQDDGRAGTATGGAGHPEDQRPGVPSHQASYLVPSMIAYTVHFKTNCR